MAVLCCDADGSTAVILEYIRARACCLRDERLTLRNTAHALGLSESTIQRALNAACGIGFHAVLERMRVERALAYLLNDPSFKVDALALFAGWSGRANLYGAIRRVTGCSLSEIRRNRERLQKALERSAIMQRTTLPSSTHGRATPSPSSCRAPAQSHSTSDARSLADAR